MKLGYRAYLRHDATLRRSSVIREQFNSLSQEEQDAVIEFYANCPPGHHVDHVYPISKGGKHCISNLQYLPAHDNCVKQDEVPEHIRPNGTLIL